MNEWQIAMKEYAACLECGSPQHVCYGPALPEGCVVERKEGQADVKHYLQSRILLNACTHTHTHSHTHTPHTHTTHAHTHAHTHTHTHTTHARTHAQLQKMQAQHITHLLTYLLKQACCSKMFCNDNIYYRVKNKLNVVCVRSTGDVRVHRLPLWVSVQPDKLVSNEGGCVLKGIRTCTHKTAHSTVGTV